MFGKITIECDEKGTHVSTNIKIGHDSDRAFLVHALGKALGLCPIDYLILCIAETEGVLDAKVVTEKPAPNPEDEELKHLLEAVIEKLEARA